MDKIEIDIAVKNIIDILKIHGATHEDMLAIIGTVNEKYKNKEIRKLKRKKGGER